MKYKIIISIFSIIVIIVYGIRLYYVNTTTYAPIIQRYEMDEEVFIENDFFYNSQEQMNGYSVTVLDTNLFTVNEFREQYNVFDDSIFEFSDFVLLVRIKFRNVSNNLGEDAGINLSYYVLQETSYINYIERDAFRILNDFDYLSFSLRQNSEKEFVIPFGINTEYIDIEKFKDGTSELVISLYPHKKVIELT